MLEQLGSGVLVECAHSRNAGGPTKKCSNQQGWDQRELRRKACVRHGAQWETDDIRKFNCHCHEIGLGIDFTARDLQQKAKEKGLPWAIAKGFNDSAPLSKFVSKHDYDLNNLDFSLTVDGDVRQSGNTSLMLFSFDYIISYLSQYFILKKGDLIFTGTPAGVGPVQIGNKLEAFLQDKKMLHVDIK